MGKLTGEACAAERAPMSLDAAAPSCEDLREAHEGWLSGWASTHDYDPSWDYDIDFGRKGSELHLLAQQAADTICSEHQDLFASARVYPARLAGGAVAVYANGTGQEPVVVIDFAAHEAGVPSGSASDAVIDSVVHEMRHAAQEVLELPFDEDEAERGSARLPF